MHYRMDSNLKNSAHFLPFIIDMPTLVGKVSSTYEAGARYIVDNGIMNKEDMRVLLEISLRSSISELNKILDTVKIEEVS